jgi:hypothetical protein
VDGTKRNASWSGSLSVNIVTGLNLAEHRIYRATVRKIIADGAFNTRTDCHHIGGIYETGTSLGMQTDDGYYISTISYAVDFAIDAGAWVELTT